MVVEDTGGEYFRSDELEMLRAQPDEKCTMEDCLIWIADGTAVFCNEALDCALLKGFPTLLQGSLCNFPG